MINDYLFLTIHYSRSMAFYNWRELAHLVEKSSIFDRLDGIKLLSTRQLKKFRKNGFLLVGSCVFD